MAQEYKLTLNLSDGSTVDTGNIIIPDGPQGPAGEGLVKRYLHNIILISLSGDILVYFSFLSSKEDIVGNIAAFIDVYQYGTITIQATGVYKDTTIYNVVGMSAGTDPDTFIILYVSQDGSVKSTTLSYSVAQFFDSVIDLGA